MPHPPIFTLTSPSHLANPLRNRWKFPVAALLLAALCPFQLCPFQLGPLQLGPSQAFSQDPWSLRQTPSVSSLRGLSPVDSNTAWVCGSQTALFRTVDRGRTWTSHPIPELQPQENESQSIELRSLHAFSSSTLLVATAGTPCRIYRTQDAGVSWTRVFEHPSSAAFIDGLRFWNETDGIAFGDPVDNQLMVLRTIDQGCTWQSSGSPSLHIEPGIAGFAASNSSLLVDSSASQLQAWIGLGGREGLATILHSRDSGTSFSRSVVDPIPSHPSAGIFSLAISPDGTLIAVGGDYQKPDSINGNVAILDPKTQRWRSPRQASPRGFRSCITYLMHPIAPDSTNPSTAQAHWITVGPTGGEWSSDGEHWNPLSDLPLHSVQTAPDGSLWACGPSGLVAVLKSQDAAPTP